MGKELALPFAPPHRMSWEAVGGWGSVGDPFLDVPRRALGFEFVPFPPPFLHLLWLGYFKKDRSNCKWKLQVLNEVKFGWH